jgi:hypothetical protein
MITDADHLNRRQLFTPPGAECVNALYGSIFGVKQSFVNWHLLSRLPKGGVARIQPHACLDESCYGLAH